MTRRKCGVFAVNFVGRIAYISHKLQALIRIAVSLRAYRAIKATLPGGQRRLKSLVNATARRSLRAAGPQQTIWAEMRIDVRPD
jgi:hypothetical protein